MDQWIINGICSCVVSLVQLNQRGDVDEVLRANLTVGVQFVAIGARLVLSKSAARHARVEIVARLGLVDGAARLDRQHHLEHLLAVAAVAVRVAVQRADDTLDALLQMRQLHHLHHLGHLGAILVGKTDASIRITGRDQHGRD